MARVGGGAIREIQRRPAILIENVSVVQKACQGVTRLFFMYRKRLDDLCQLCGVRRGQIVDL